MEGIFLLYVKGVKNNFFNISDFYFFTKLYVNSLPLPPQKWEGSCITSYPQEKLKTARTLVLTYV